MLAEQQSIIVMLYVIGVIQCYMTLLVLFETRSAPRDPNILVMVVGSAFWFITTMLLLATFLHTLRRS